MLWLEHQYPDIPGPERYWGLMRDSAFVLILPGDRPAVSRYVEAVCSGAVPVWVDPIEEEYHWVPPFSQVIPLTTYAIVCGEAVLPDLPAHLRAIPKNVVASLRRNASRVCFNHVGTIDGIADTVLDAASRLAHNGQSYAGRSAAGDGAF